MAVAAGLAADAGDLLSGPEQDTLSLRFQLRGEQPVEDVTVVAIDDVTFSDLRRQWPFPRSLHARAIDRLRSAGARVIAYDIQFTEETKPREDLALFDPSPARPGSSWRPPRPTGAATRRSWAATTISARPVRWPAP